MAWGPYTMEAGFRLGGSLLSAHWGALWPFFFSSGWRLRLPLCFLLGQLHVLCGESSGGEAAVCRAGRGYSGKRGDTHQCTV